MELWGAVRCSLCLILWIVKSQCQEICKKEQRKKQQHTVLEQLHLWEMIFINSRQVSTLSNLPWKKAIWSKVSVVSVAVTNRRSFVSMHFISKHHMFDFVGTSIPFFNGPWNLIHVYETAFVHAERANVFDVNIHTQSRKEMTKNFNLRTQKPISTLILISSALLIVWHNFKN